MGNYRNTYFDNNASNHGWYTCVRCGKKLRKGDADIDHIIPQSYGGSDDEINLQCLCVHCNRSKRDDTSDSLSGTQHWPHCQARGGKESDHQFSVQKAFLISSYLQTEFTHKHKNSHRAV